METITLKTGFFEPLSFDEIQTVDGGGTVENALKYTGGIALIVWAPIVGAAIAVSSGGTATATGVSVFIQMIGVGTELIGSAE